MSCPNLSWTYHYLNFLQKICISFFVYSKSEYTTKIGQCVRPAVRPSVYTITLQKYQRFGEKFCPRNCLIHISVEFEDENHRSRNDWVIVKILKTHQTIPEGEYRDFQKKIFRCKFLTTYISRLSFSRWFRIWYQFWAKS